MIKTLRLRYFQAHKNSTLEFHPGINAICGASDQGKSSIIRAIRWIVENRPAGDSFRSHFAEKHNTEVSMILSNGQVDRVKGPKENKYQIGEEEYKAMGQKVPEEVTQLLNLRPVNIQYQMDQPFLLSLGGPALSKYLNEEVHLDVIDRSISNIRKKLMGNNTKLAAVELQKESLAKALSELPDLNGIDGRLGAVEQMERQAQQLKNNHTSLTNLITRIESNQNHVNNHRTVVLQSKKHWERIDTLHSDLKTIVRKEEDLKKLSQRIQTMEDEKRDCTFIINQLKPITIIEEKAKTLIPITETIKKLKGLISRINASQTALLIANDRKEKARNAYQKAIPETCPTCGQAWARNS